MHEVGQNDLVLSDLEVFILGLKKKLFRSKAQIRCSTGNYPVQKEKLLHFVLLSTQYSPRITPKNQAGANPEQLSL